jgi:hypothetical protein
MPLWGNTDAANNKPHFSNLREVLPIASFITANATAIGANGITFTSNANFSTLSAGMFVYSSDANNAISRANKDLSVIDGNEMGFWKSNNTITQIDTANSKILVRNNAMFTLASGSTVVVGNAISYHASTSGFSSPVNAANDVILVTTTRMANTSGTTGAGGSNVANTKLGAINQGWNRITRKINSDGTIRFLKETLVALANAQASNTSSANTSANAIFGGV